MPTLYAHEESTRRTIVYLAEAVAIAMVIIAAAFSAPWFFWLPVGLAAGMLTWMLLNPKISGSRITSQAVEIYVNGKVDRYPMADILFYRRKAWMESSDWVYLCLRNGEEDLMPAYCVGNIDDFIEALEDCGITRKP
jgi:hypothetical protein